VMHRAGDKKGRRGTFIIDRRTRVGRIAVASGTTHAPTLRRLDEMITTLNETGRDDILRAVREGELTPLSVYAAFRVNELHRLPLGKELLPLKDAMTKWNEASEVGDQRKAANKSGIKRLAEKASTVGNLPDALLAVRVDLIKEKHPAHFNRIRATCLAFIRDTLKRSHHLYGEIMDVPLLKERKAPKKQPQTWAQLVAHAEKMNAVNPRFRVALWAMALCGMGPKEYWIDGYEVLTDRVSVGGVKRPGRQRAVPALRTDYFTRKVPSATVGAEREMRVFGETLLEKCGIHPYDLRRSYANWMEAAGIPRTRRRLYMGHAKKDTTDIYEEHEVTAFLADDAKRLEAYLGGSPITSPITTLPDSDR
jgi:hypothetical protein